MPRRRLVLVLIALLSVLGVPALAAPPVALEDTFAPSEPVSRDFPSDFLRLLPLDRQEQRASVKDWKDPHVGGWGGTLAGGASCAGWYRRPHKVVHRPVVFVHGNTSDAEFWRGSDSGEGSIENVRARFLGAGYAPCELWAVSYDGAPGFFTYNDINVAEVYAFLTGVRGYLGAGTVDVVSHSLGVTIVRKAALLHPQLYDWLKAFVGLAGANHGTTTCRQRGSAHDSYVCEETEPGSAWLTALNAGPRGAGESPRGPRYLTIYDGSGAADDFYLGPDAQSPALAGKGVCNHQMPFTAHNSFAIEGKAIDYYLRFLATAACPD
jgi:pimeloyl-ACP methyl ester carboxylesterase